MQAYMNPYTPKCSHFPCLFDFIACFVIHPLTYPLNQDGGIHSRPAGPCRVCVARVRVSRACIFSALWVMLVHQSDVPTSHDGLGILLAAACLFITVTIDATTTTLAHDCSARLVLRLCVFPLFFFCLCFVFVLLSVAFFLLPLFMLIRLRTCYTRVIATFASNRLPTALVISSCCMQCPIPQPFVCSLPFPVYTNSDTRAEQCKDSHLPL